MTDNTFNTLNLSKDILKTIEKKGFTTPTEVQKEVVPLIIEKKHDIIAIAQTGTGKTGAFGLPLVDKIEKKNIPQAIILAPTRELAIQVTKELSSYSYHKNLAIETIYGGASIEKQMSKLKKGVDIVVGTPGRVVDMIKRRALNLSSIEYFVLDEADEMLKMGFIEDLEFTLEKTPQSKRVYLFSATMPKEIKELSKNYMKKQKIIELKTNMKVHSELIDQIFYRVNRTDKTQTIVDLLDSKKDFYGIIFCKTKSEVDQVARDLRGYGFKADAIHGDIKQNRREKILQQFRDMKIDILVATDVAARGIDVNNLTDIINHSLPQSIDGYVHRIGRTGRAGNKGNAISLMTPSEMRRLSTLEKQTGFRLRKEELPPKSNRVKKIKVDSYQRRGGSGGGRGGGKRNFSSKKKFQKNYRSDRY